MFVRHAPARTLPMFPAGLGEVPSAVPADNTTPDDMPGGGAKVQDLSMFLSVLSSLVLIFRS